MKFDLHTHTTASDGTLTPAELIILAKESGLKGVAITDHDTVDGIPEALAVAKKHNIELLPGIELSTRYAGYEVHVLGYLIDWQEIAFIEALEGMKKERYARAKEILIRLSQLGLPIDFDKVQEIAGRGVIGRPHIGRAMVELGYAVNVREAFTRFLGKDGIAYIPRKKFSLEEGLDLLTNAKGIPVLAHPGLLDNSKMVPVLLEKGFLGLEVYHPEHSVKEVDYYLSLCKDYDLIPTGGSDFHGSIRENRLGSFGVGSQTVKNIKNKQKNVIAKKT